MLLLQASVLGLVFHKPCLLSGWGVTLYDMGPLCMTHVLSVETSPPPRPVLEQTLAGAFRVTTQLHALGALQGKIRVFCIHVVMS